MGATRFFSFVSHDECALCYDFRDNSSILEWWVIWGSLSGSKTNESFKFAANFRTISRTSFSLMTLQCSGFPQTGFQVINLHRGDTVKSINCIFIECVSNYSIKILLYIQSKSFADGCNFPKTLWTMSLLEHLTQGMCIWGKKIPSMHPKLFLLSKH